MKSAGVTTIFERNSCLLMVFGSLLIARRHQPVVTLAHGYSDDHFTKCRVFSRSRLVFSCSFFNAPTIVECFCFSFRRDNSSRICSIIVCAVRVRRPRRGAWHRHRSVHPVGQPRIASFGVGRLAEDHDREDSSPVVNDGRKITKTIRHTCE